MYDDIFQTKHGFVAPPEHIPTEEDMVRYADKDAEINSLLIEGLIGYVVNSVNWFLKVSPTAEPYSEDCISESMIELTRFVNSNAGRVFTPQHFMNAARLSCLGAVKKWLREMSVVVTLPATTGRRHNLILTKQKLLGTERMTGDDIVFDTVWFDTFLETLDSFDRKLVELRMAGFSDRHIGREVGMHYHHVKNHLVRIANFYLDGE
jgi:hypothetical protein